MAAGNDSLYRSGSQMMSTGDHYGHHSTIESTALSFGGLSRVLVLQGGAGTCTFKTQHHAWLREHGRGPVPHWAR